MTRHAVVIPQRHFDRLNQLVFDVPGAEGAAFLLCGESVSKKTTKLVVHAVVSIDAQDYLVREPYHLSIASHALTRVAKLAKYENLSVIFVHSHPGGIPEFSDQDDREEAKLLPFLQARVPGRVHGTMVVTETTARARLYKPDQATCDLVLAVGNRIRLWAPGEAGEVSPVFDRQVRAFGPDTQRTLSCLTIGIVGTGGTGSATAEQLYRLGVGRLMLFEGDTFDRTNVNRVYGSSLNDHGKPKVEITKAHLDGIGLDTEVEAVPGYITDELVAKRLRECDVIFSCPDKQIPRAILTSLALKYCIPVFDLGAVIDSKDGHIKGVYGRVTTLVPGAACLFCRGRITSERMRIETLSPEERKLRAKEGYAPELEDPAPAVIPFTSTIASLAVAELIHRLTGFMGADRTSSEVLVAFDQSRIRTNQVEPLEECFCSDDSQWGRGDEEPFLGQAWPSRTK